MKMTREERNWVLYDVGNSAFVLLVSTIMPLYFNYLAGRFGLSCILGLCGVDCDNNCCGHGIGDRHYGGYERI